MAVPELLPNKLPVPPLNPVEMACESFDQIIDKLAEDKDFVSAFNEVYADGLSEKNITDAIQEFEKTLLTPQLTLRPLSERTKKMQSPKTKSPDMNFQEV